MDQKDTEEFASIVEGFINSDGSVDKAVKILAEEGEDKEAVKGAIGKMFDAIDRAFELKADIEERGEVQAFHGSERGGTDDGLVEIDQATAEAVDALNEEA